MPPVLLLSALTLLALPQAPAAPKAPQAAKVSPAPIPPAAAYLGQKRPGAEPEPFAPALLAPFRYLGRIAFSPDGRECCFTTTDATWSTSHLWVTRWDGTRWTEPVKAPWTTGLEAAGEPWYRPDGRTLFFTGRNPGSTTGMDIWKVEGGTGAWGAPVRVASPVNSDANDYCYSEAPDGTAYLLSERTGTSQVHILRPGNPVRDEQMPAPLYSRGTFEGDPCIAPDGHFLVWYSGRRGRTTLADLFVAFRDAKGGWTAPVHLGPGINTPADEYGATLSPDGKYLFFVRFTKEACTLHWMAVEGLDRLRP